MLAHFLVLQSLTPGHNSGKISGMQPLPLFLAASQIHLLWEATFIQVKLAPADIGILANDLYVNSLKSRDAADFEDNRIP